MTRRLPIVSTLIVAVAVAVMIGLGVWQLQRAKLHAAQLAGYQSAARLPPIAFPTAPVARNELPLYRYATGNCLRVVARRTAAGANRADEPGFLIIADCATGAEGPGMSVELGWSKNPNATFDWAGGLVSGTIVPDRVSRMRLVAASPVPGLEASAVPTPRVQISPGRNRGYALTWFALAAAALAVYAIAVRKHLKPREQRR
jgi:cytochrome oxidase assembly protein ShyY1